MTILGQVPALLGVSPEEDFPDFWRDLREILQVLDDVQTQTAVLGIGSLVALYLMKRFVPKIPGSLVVLIGSMVIVAVASLVDDCRSSSSGPSRAVGFDRPVGADHLRDCGHAGSRVRLPPREVQPG